MTRGLAYFLANVPVWAFGNVAGNAACLLGHHVMVSRQKSETHYLFVKQVDSNKTFDYLLRRQISED